MQNKIVNAYAAKSYNENRQRYIEVNIPDILPTIPKDNKNNVMTIVNSYFINSNYTSCPAKLISAHSITLPIASGCNIPYTINKGDKFFIICTDDRIESGSLMLV